MKPLAKWSWHLQPLSPTLHYWERVGYRLRVFPLLVRNNWMSNKWGHRGGSPTHRPGRISAHFERQAQDYCCTHATCQKTTTFEVNLCKMQQSSLLEAGEGCSLLMVRYASRSQTLLSWHLPYTADIKCLQVFIVYRWLKMKLAFIAWQQIRKQRNRSLLNL